ncbi:MAG TPA: DUF4230 domain-containing protein [Saprospiraceae bacterium]|nr:DUF4230 domain-containing protein [Saprospiraceae bacterium]HMQ81830.1 DUF4230 domain-containing protein [Saprospiraceae bacterium]
MIKNALILLALIAAAGIGYWVATSLYKKKVEEQISSNSTVLLEKIQKVCKLVTVEGQFSELYDETNIRQFTLYLPLPTTWKFSKQAIIKVNGTVLVGYDMEKVSIEVDSANREIRLSNLPKPSILSIDHNTEYKNLEDSFFNSFDIEDYNRLNKNAKAVLAEKAKESGLLEEASQQGNQMIDAIRFMVESAGWSLVVASPTPLVPADSLLQN